MQILLRAISIVICILYHLCVTGQVISFYNDSLKINKTYIDAHTSPKQLDILLGYNHSTVKGKSDFMVSTPTGKSVCKITYFYSDLGISFTTYEDDPLKYSFFIKRSNDSNPKTDFERKIKKPFSGYLFIASNDLTGKRTIEDFKNMENVSVSFQQINSGSLSTILGGEIYYQKDIIKLSVDRKNGNITGIYFHHHFPH